MAMFVYSNFKRGCAHNLTNMGILPKIPNLFLHHPIGEKDV